jgi:tRNA-dihydrouridine synthase
MGICHGFMIARGAIHNPKIFEEYKNFSLSNYLLESGIEFNEDEFENDNEEIIDTTEKNKMINLKATDYDDVKASNKLSKIFEKKYNKNKIDIVPMIREYVELALKLGYNYNNAKYVILYILKTHKNELPLFKKLTSSRGYEEICTNLQMREVYDEIIKSNEKVLGYADGSIYKNRFKNFKV